MSIAHRRTKLVLAAFEQLASQGREVIRPGDLGAQLRERNTPLSYWEIRGELTTLETSGLIELDAPTGGWRLVPAAARKAG